MTGWRHPNAGKIEITQGGIGGTSIKELFDTEAGAWPRYLALTSAARNAGAFTWTDMWRLGTYGFPSEGIAHDSSDSRFGPIDTRHPLERMFARAIASGEPVLVISENEGLAFNQVAA